jgi:oligoendopeptidase F
LNNSVNCLTCAGEEQIVIPLYLQFWVKSRENQKEAMKDYLHICEIGGSKTFLEIVKEGNLQSPFKEGTVADIVKVADTWIKERTPMFIKH